MFFGIVDIVTFILGTVFIVLLPGPNSLFVMTVASQRGVRLGYQGAMGIFVGDTVLMLLSATGMASLLHTLPAVFDALKYAGGAYLVWLGAMLLRGGWRQWQHRHQAQTQAAVAGDQRHPFRTALLISLMNPKAILFFVSFFIQFVSPDYPYPALSFLILGLIVQACSLLYLSALIWGGAGLARYFRQHRRLSAAGTAGVGALFVLFGGRLATAGL